MATQAFVPGLAEALARDLTGLAVIGTLDEGASWAVTAALGREWSCYNHAIRLYWPTKGKIVSAYSHPLWTRDRLLESGGNSETAVQRLRNQLRRLLLAISTYTISEPPLLTRVWQEASESRLRELRARAEEQGEWQALAEEYAKENTALSAQVAKLAEINVGLEDQVSNLNLAFKYRDDANQEAIPPEDEPAIETVADAIEAARKRFGLELVFGNDVVRGVETIAIDAGPPDKVFEYLRTLAEMTQRRQSEGLGKDMIQWLNDQGVKASTESETTINNNAEMKRRTWDSGSGQTRRFVRHLKPKEATSPDQCVRIYFDYDEVAAMTVVGWVGRHP
jgi:hypothetical protein